MFSISFELILVMALCLSAATLLQTLSGFGFGLLVVASFTLLDVLPLTATTFLVSLLGLVNSTTVVVKNRNAVKIPELKLMLYTGIPLMLLGFVLLEYMSAHLTQFLNFILGISILLCCALMLVKRKRTDRPSRPRSFLIAGGVSGLLGGLFSTSGPPLVFQCYKQAWSIEAIRSTLLAVFTIGGIVRVGIALFGTLPDLDIMFLIAAAIPLVLLVTHFSRRLTPYVDAKWIRIIAITLLGVSGISLVVTSAPTLV
ncbi:sulfite exporter TauE/SafE family protein [Pseudoalteromonas marina]|uniref:sulfite exporter TauE/SafE family protein n=1 Tax=Pseudoalteromonas marina TaxID=267375 RepID=UPI00031B93BA|nr:sulfite exporter TauE/SafE family protein [Pseudoalteromonas marina]MDP2485938.1 sulfite exporter TauE/SafE family protein [Pseudoalteromonas marina]